MATWVHEIEGRESDDIMRVLTALSEFVKASAGLQTRYGLPAPFTFGAGINTGLATVGNAGTGDLTEYTALGDAVNAAFRIEASTRETGVDLALGETTCSYIRNRQDAEQYFEQRTVQLKGYDQPATVWATSFDRINALLKLPAQR